jgi:asparagine synthase (glutamine-hydrolysing)
MCGILAFFDPNGYYKGTPEELKAYLASLSHRMRSRGPDGNGYFGGSNWGLSHERLAIMDPEGGQQPIIYEDRESPIALVANGEIYNHKALEQKYNLQPMRTGSDSEPLI